MLELKSTRHGTPEMAHVHLRIVFATALHNMMTRSAAAAVCMLLVYMCVLLSSVRGPAYAGDMLQEDGLWEETRMSPSLCATQAVKLPDCMPKRLPVGHSSHPSSFEHSKYSPYVSHGKPIPWSRVKQVVALHPKTVLKQVKDRTNRIRQRLDSMSASEVIAEEAVKQQQRRLKAAQARIRLILKAQTAPPHPLGKTQAREGKASGAAASTSAAGGVSRSGVAGGSVAASVLSAMALTMAAEQREINQLRKRLKARRLTASAPPSQPPTQASTAEATTQRLPAHTPTHIPRQNASDSTAGMREDTPRVNVTALAGEVARLLAAKIQAPIEKENAMQEARAAEDARLARRGAIAVALKEKAMISAEKHEQHQMLQMHAWADKLAKGGLHSIGIKEYGVKKAMRHMRHLANRKVLPQKLDYMQEARELEQAGVSKDDITNALHLPLNPPPTHVAAAVSSATTTNADAGLRGGGLRGAGDGGEGAGGELFGDAHLGRGGGGGSRPGGVAEGISGDVTDLKGLQEVGNHISAKSAAQASVVVASLMSARARHAVGADSVTNSPLTPRMAGALKIQVYPGSARPLRTHLDPTSISFWKKLDKAGVDVTRKSNLQDGDPASLFT